MKVVLRITTDTPLQQPITDEGILKYFRNTPIPHKWGIAVKDSNGKMVFHAKLTSLDAAQAEVAFMTKVWETCDASGKPWNVQFRKPDDVQLVLCEALTSGPVTFVFDEKGRATILNEEKRIDNLLHAIFGKPKKAKAAAKKADNPITKKGKK